MWQTSAIYYLKGVMQLRILLQKGQNNAKFKCTVWCIFDVCLGNPPKLKSLENNEWHIFQENNSGQYRKLILISLAAKMYMEKKNLLSENLKFWEFIVFRINKQLTLFSGLCIYKLCYQLNLNFQNDVV